MAVGGADRLEHADRAEPSLGEDGEPADGNKGDEQHAEYECGERDRLGVERVGLCDRGRRLHLRADRAGINTGSIEERHHLGRRIDLPRHDERELVEEALGVLDDADYVAFDTTDSPGVPDLEVER